MIRCEANEYQIKERVQLAIERDVPLYLIVLATKPCYIKLAPLVREAVTQNLPFLLVDTGHHYSPELTGAARDFEIDGLVHFRLEIRGSILQRTSHLASKCELLADYLLPLTAGRVPVVPLVSGDTSTSAAFPFFWYLQTGVRCFHIEAGLRSRTPFHSSQPSLRDLQRQSERRWLIARDDPFPEGLDTRMSSVAASRLYAPVDINRLELVREGYSHEEIVRSGSLSADAVSEGEKRSSVLQKPGKALRFDVHRRENMSLARLDAIVGAASEFSRCGNEVEFVLTNQVKIHFDRYKDARDYRGELSRAGVDCCEIIPSYLDFLGELNRGRYQAIVTDSGGMQEETAILGAKCATVRYSTDRPETVTDFASNLLVPPVSKELLIDGICWWLSQPGSSATEPYGKNVSNLIVSDLLCQSAN